MQQGMFIAFIDQVALTARMTLAAFYSPRRLHEQRAGRVSNSQPEGTKEKPDTVSPSLNQPAGTSPAAGSVQLPGNPGVNEPQPPPSKQIRARRNRSIYLDKVEQEYVATCFFVPAW